ncbi:MAG: DNA sulfur modification protein DndD [Gammaproteobacteria bacterium]|nr:DNA sulfur modification protein DndD [Gammaproteobacteria bacterium]
MILDRLSLCDFRAYRGLHQIELGPRVKYGSQRPIILFGGLNGAGKTTLLMAIRLALYGRHALGMGTSKANYTKFIRGCIHSSPKALVRPNSAYVELDFTYGKLGRKTHYRVRRSWLDDGRTVRELLSLWEDGTPKTSLSEESCQGFLNELVPIGVSELFFFDGEKIAELAEDDSGTALGDAIHRLLGLDLVERLRSDLRIYMLRSESQAAGKDAATEIEDLQRDYEDIKAELEEHRAELDRVENELSELIVQRDRLEVRLTERGGDWGTSREAQRARAKELVEALRRAERELREELTGPYPLFLAREALVDALEFAAAELESLTKKEANQLLTRFASTLKEQLDGDGQATVDHLLSQSLHPETTANREPFIDLSHRAVGRMEHTVHSAVPEAEARVERAAKEIALFKDELDTVTLRIEQAPDEAVLAKDFSELAALNERISEAGAEAAVRSREVKAAYTKAIEIARSLRDKHKALAEARQREQPLEYADGARHLLSDFRRINAERKIGRLENEFAAAFRRLARKDDIVVKARIDPRRFTVKLINGDNDEIQKSQLSAGEKQIYAIAMLEALARTSGRHLPVVIDTPLGRLDSHHRANLVSHYFPKASHQVILLSTDTEVDESFYRQLSPQISHAFEIIYNDQDRAANLREGYFWRNKLRAVQ